MALYSNIVLKLILGPKLMYNCYCQFFDSNNELNA